MGKKVKRVPVNLDAGDVAELLHRTKRMSMLLQDNIVVSPIKDVKPYIGLLRMLCQKPPSVSDHSNPAIVAALDSPPLDHERHIIVVGVAVADKQDI